MIRYAGEQIFEQANTNINKSVFGSIIYNVKAYGAKGNGQSDDTSSIQATIDKCYADGGGIVFFPSGTYNVSASLIKKEKVSLIGSGTYSTFLQFTANVSDAVIDTVNQRLSGTSIENMTITKSSSVSADITGVLGGSDVGVYNSTGLTTKNVRFLNLKYGMRGNGTNDVGIYDSIFENVTCDNCYYGLFIHGSQNTIRFPRMLNCDYGIVLGYLSNISFAGVQVYGGILIGNGVDLYVPHAFAQTTRPCIFDGVWFEGATTSIVKIDEANSQLMTWTFINCMLSADATSSLMDFSNAIGSITIFSSTIYQTNASFSKSPTHPTASGGRLYLMNVYLINSNGTTDFISPVVTVMPSAAGDKMNEQAGATATTSLTGSATTTINVTFTTPFNEVPFVWVQSGSGNQITCTVGNVTTTGFSIFAYNANATASTQIRWLAKGK